MLLRSLQLIENVTLRGFEMGHWRTGSGLIITRKTTPMMVLIAWNSARQDSLPSTTDKQV